MLELLARPTFAEVVAEGNLFAVSRPYRRTDRRSRPWVVEYRDVLTEVAAKRCFRTEAEAWAFYNRNSDDREAMRNGSLTRRQVAVGQRGLTLITTAAEDYRKSQLARGLSDAHVIGQSRTILKVAAYAKWSQVKDIAPGPAQLWLGEISNGTTARRYWSDLRAFVRWLVSMNYLTENPLMGITAPAKATPKNKRALTEDEFARLVGCPAIMYRRRLWYWIAGRTGLRHTEIARLRWEHIDFTNACVRLPGELTKNGRDATIPIPRALFAELRQARQAPAAKVLPNKGRPGPEIWSADLVRAGIKEVSDEGIVMLSSLRVSYATHLIQKGVKLTDVQKLMRHSNINLTVNIYNRVRPSDLADAVEKLG